MLFEAGTTRLEIDVERIVNALELEPVLMGNELVCRCPFHHETGNPNLEINIETGLWLCWVCGEKGNLAGLITRLHTVSFREAIHYLENHSDIPTIQELRARNLRELDSILNPPRARAFQTVDVSHYLHGGVWWHHIRGFPREIVERFALGFDSRNRRAVIPVGMGGKWIGTIRRATQESQMPRYLFDSAFPKGRVLFAWDRVPDEAHSCILVEGATDCIRAHSFGYLNTLGILGTSLTEAQCSLIGGRFDEVTIFLDNDPAGFVGTLRNAKLLSRDIARVLVVSYDEIEKKDPDELAANEFEQIFENRRHWSSLIT